MDPEATGYENIFLRGLFLGLTRKEVQSRLTEIAEFTELGNFLDLPIRTYSAGMRMRLAFAVSTSIEPDILLLDEGIGAGDAAFLEKADGRLAQLSDKAGIIVLASHSESLAKSMCHKAVLLERGQVIATGETAAILDLYRQRGHH
jgi:ABC-2 type transport system ATP-binding protein/lipopolysaccharide transport system ATP-binding protein